MNDLMFTSWLEYRDELAMHRRRASAPVEETARRNIAPEKVPEAEPVCMTISNYSETSDTCWYRVEETTSGDQCVAEWGTLMDDNSYVECSRSCFDYPEGSGVAGHIDFWGNFQGWLDPK